MNAGVIDTIIRDLELERDGARLYYAVDAHDVTYYCFPVHETGPVDLDRIANEQAGWDQIFRVRKIRPLLPREYYEELDAYVEIVRKQASRYGAAAVLARILDLTQRSKRHVLEDVANPNIRKEDLRNFNIALMMHLGLYNIGLERLHWTRNRFNNPESKEMRAVLTEADREYIPSPLVGDITKYLADTRDPAFSSSGTEGFYRDAAVIDRLLFLNERLIAAYPERLESLHLILYLSSAGRTKRIFEQDFVINLLPKVSGHSYSIHRTFEHPYTLLALSVDGSDNSFQDDLGASIERLKGIRDLLRWDTLNKLNRHLSANARARCTKCIQEGGREEDCEGCISLKRCQAVKALEGLRASQGRSMLNLGLLSKIQSYADLAVGTKEVGKSRLGKLHQFFKESLNDADVQSRALAKMLAIENLMRVQRDFREFTYYVTPSLRREDNELVRYQAHFFLLAPFDEENHEFIEQLVELEEIIGDEVYRRYDEVATDFLNRETRKETGTIIMEAPHELVRGLLYLCAPTNSGDQHAYKHATMLATQFQSSEFQNHILFFASWCCICVGRFDEARKYASEGAERFPDDPKFPHLLARANIREIEMNSADKGRESFIQEAIVLQRQAVALAEKSPKNPWLVGVMYNSLAFYLCQIDWAVPGFNKQIEEARKAVRQLKTAIPKEQWHPAYSNFFHTEAYLEYQEALSAELDAKKWERDAKDPATPISNREGCLNLGKTQRDLARFKLERALIEIEEALRYDAKLRYTILKDDILRKRIYL